MQDLIETEFVITSKYINDIYKFFRKKGLQPIAAKSETFNVIKMNKKQGVPTLDLVKSIKEASELLMNEYNSELKKQGHK